MMIFCFSACVDGPVAPTEIPVSESPSPNPSLALEPGYISPSPTPEPDNNRRSTVYMLTDEGYILPVTMQIPWEDGIAKACLSRLISTPENHAEMQKLGLQAPIPYGTVIELNIEDSLATVNLRNMPPIDSAERERALFVAIVNTLTEFPSVEKVTVLINGNAADTPNGVSLPKQQSRYALNVENPDIATSGTAHSMLLYFPNEAGSLSIPVTRYSNSEADLYTVIRALAAGTALDGLRSCFPKDTLVLAATIENGILTVNLSSDFETIRETVGLYELACHTVMLTAAPYGNVNEVRFTVNGKVFEP